MKTILIVFAILLFLLICLAAFGGTISYREPFYETSVVDTPSAPHHLPPPPAQMNIDPSLLAPPQDDMIPPPQPPQRDEFYDMKPSCGAPLVDAEHEGFSIEPFEVEQHSMPAAY